MQRKTTCKLCRRAITLVIHDDYPAFRDPWNLVRLAVCNDCYDLADRREKIETWLIATCFRLCHEKKMKEPQRLELRDALISATRKYALVISIINHQSSTHWTPEFPESLYNTPDRWPILLRQFRRGRAGDSTADSPTTPASLPYADA